MFCSPACVPKLQLQTELCDNSPAVFCNWYTNSDVSKINVGGGAISLLNVNIRSVRRNFPCLESFLDMVNASFDIIAVTEKWLETC